MCHADLLITTLRESYQEINTAHGRTLTVMKKLTHVQYLVAMEEGGVSSLPEVSLDPFGAVQKATP
jgi:hypothetical protein